MGTIFQGLEDSYVQNVAAYNVFMYLMNNVKVRDYVKENELTLEQIVTHINDNWDDIINDFSTNPDYEMQSEDDIHTTVDAFAQMYEVAMKIVAENSEVSNTILKSPSWIEEYDRNDCHNGAVFEDEDGVYYVVFEGTIDAEWLDNGEALAGKESEQQENAVEYFNMVAQDLGWTTDDTIIVSGHSKGGNKAQYTTLYAAQPELIDYCISINGQGFSNMEEEEYYTKHSEQQRQEAIDKMYSLCGEYDYVHGLGNVIIPEERTTIIDLDNDKFYEDFVGVGHCMPWFFYRDGEFHGDLNPIGAESSLSGLVTEASNRVMELSDSELQNLTLASMQLMEIVNARSEDGYDMERASKENLEKCLVYAVPIILESIFATEPGQEFTKEIVDNLVAPKVQEYANDIIKEAKIKVLFFSIKSCFMVGEIARGILTGNININISNLYSFIESVIPDINASENDVQVEGALNGMLVGAEHEINKKFIEKENEWLDKFDGSEELSELAWELIVDSYYNIHGGQRDDMVYGTSDDNIIRLASGKVTTAYGRQGADTIFGSQQDDYLDGGSGNDTLYGNEGNDTLLGQKGCDSLYGGEGDDELAGGSNSDFLFGDAGNDKLDGGSAADYLYGGDGDDILTGGVGNDILIGGKGIDTYVIDAHHGDDIIVNHRIVNEENERDIILFEDDVKKENLTIQRRDADLLIVNNVNGQITTVKNVFITQRTPKTDDYDLSELVQGRIDGAGIIAESGVLYTDTNGLDVYSIPNIRFDDGTVWDKKEILKRLSVSGTKANDELEGISGVTQFYSADETFLAGDGEDKVYGNEGDDIIYGEGGNDKLSGGTGNDTIYGGSGTDYLYGDNGNDTLHGGVGNDTLIGGSGRNTYIINQDSDNDYIRLTDGEDSKIVFGKGIKSEDINVVRHYYGYRLENKVTGQTIRVQSYYTQDKTLVCEFDDGQIIDLNNVEVTKGTGGIKFSSYGSIDYESIDRMIMRLNVWNSSISSDIYFSKIKNAF